MGCFSDLQVFRFGEFPDLIASNFDFERKLFLDQNGLDTYAHTLHTIHCIRHTHTGPSKKIVTLMFRIVNLSLTESSLCEDSGECQIDVLIYLIRVSEKCCCFGRV